MEILVTEINLKMSSPEKPLRKAAVGRSSLPPEGPPVPSSWRVPTRPWGCCAELMYTSITRACEQERAGQEGMLCLGQI
jgi:hypothetical protein